MWLAWDGEWRSLVARFVRDEEVPGSNPGSPTNTARDRRCVTGASGLIAGLVCGERVYRLGHPHRPIQLMARSRLTTPASLSADYSATSASMSASIRFAILLTTAARTRVELLTPARWSPDYSAASASISFAMRKSRSESPPTSCETRTIFSRR